ncbi:MAG: serine/threonine-protein kinase [Cellvibrionaceae bacterium]
MKQIAETIAAWFNLRALAGALGLALFLSPTTPPAFESFDKFLFQIGVALQTPPRPTLGVSIVELPADEIGYLIEDPGKADRTYRLLNRLTASDKITVGLLLPKPLATQPRTAEHLLDDLIGNGEGTSAAIGNEQRNAISAYLGVARGLRRFGEHPQVVVGSPETVIVGGAAVQRQPSTATDYARWLPAWLRPRLPESDSGQALSGNNIGTLWQDEGQLHTSFLLEIYARLANIDQLTWHEYTGVQLGALQFPLSADGHFMPYPNPLSGNRYSLDEALEDRLADNLILLGAAGSTELHAIANALSHLDQNSYYRIPFWFTGVELALLLLLVLYLMMLLPRLSYTAGVLATCLLVVVLLVVQLGWQITQWQWLPLGLAVQFLVLGHLLIVFWKRRNNQTLQLQAVAHGARYQLGLQLFRDGRGDDALLAVRECLTSEAVLGLMYDIASQQERKRHYGEAVKTYMAIVSRQKHFRDAAEKVEKLMAFSSGGASTIGKDADIAKTLIISESSISKPVLGRYEIERELGRGAMGVVYLGRDPKIAREVAIKTLSYAQLDALQLDEFKQRFFREAEAAGRLNHPNIVIVYDVGEEHDLAFIAMDYIKGNALSAYSKEPDLLPAIEVLRIGAEVADALEYAHQNQIIHRDIKPANIMYQPKNGHIKVTDFGVARIVDSAKTSTGDLLGSPLYMSPEQLQGGRVGRETDVYSLGVTLYQLLTGALPFTGDNLANLTYNIINERQRSIRELRPDLPAGVTRMINKALQKDPDKRYTSAGAMAEALRKLLAEL